MSKLYDKYCRLRKTGQYDENTIFLFKSGAFYILIDIDAVKVSKLLKLKLTKIDNLIYKCSFPVVSLNKYSPILSHKYKIEIFDIDAKNNKTPHYISDKRLRDVMERLLRTDIEALSISQAFDLLQDMKDEFYEITGGIEDEYK